MPVITNYPRGCSLIGHRKGSRQTFHVLFRPRPLCCLAASTGRLDPGSGRRYFLAKPVVSTAWVLDYGALDEYDSYNNLMAKALERVALHHSLESRLAILERGRDPILGKYYSSPTRCLANMKSASISIRASGRNPPHSFYKFRSFPYLSFCFSF